VFKNNKLTTKGFLLQAQNNQKKFYI